MELTIAERLMAQAVLPAKGTFVTVRIIMEAQRVLGFTSDEIEEFGLKAEVGAEGQVSTRWSPEHADTVRDVPLTTAALDIIKEALGKLNGAGELTAQHVSLFEKVHAAKTE